MELRVADRSERGKLRFTGPQDAWFLHQILTQDFEGMTVGESRDAAQLTAHGRMVGYLEFVRTAEGFLCHFEDSLKETYPDAIARYVFATQVEIADLSDDFGLVVVAGEGWERTVELHLDAVAQSTRSLGVDAGYLWVPRAETAALLDKLVADGASLAAEDELEAIRIANGAPRWGWEMDTKTIPQEVGIESWAVDFGKGCYVGQEAMAKIHFRGKVNKRLARLAGPGLEPGSEVTLEGKPAGKVTSVNDGNALAVLRYTIEPGSEVTVRDAQVEVVG